MRPPHAALGGAFKNSGQFCIRDRIAGLEVVLERQWIPPWYRSRIEGFGSKYRPSKNSTQTDD